MSNNTFILDLYVCLEVKKIMQTKINDDDNFLQSWFDRLPAVSGFLGGITIAIMVVIMQSKDKFAFSWFSNLTGVDYTQILLVSLAAVGSLFVFISLFVMGNQSPKSKTADFLIVLIGVAFFALLALFPLLLLPFSSVAAAILVGIEVAITCVWVKLGGK